MGRSDICACESSALTSAVSVCRVGGAVVTVTSDFTLASWSAILTRASWLTDSGKFFCAYAPKLPKALTSTVYGPASRFCTRYAPELLVVTLRVSPLAWLVTVTVTLGPAALLASVTIPVMEPYRTCALAVEKNAVAIRNVRAKHHAPRRPLRFKPLLVCEIICMPPIKDFKQATPD